VPNKHNCQVVKRTLRRWENLCGVNLPNQVPPGIKDETKDYSSFRRGECGYNYSNGQWGPNYVQYDSYVDENIGWWEVVAGEEPAVQWELNDMYKNEAYRLALVWKDRSSTSYRRFARTLAYKDAEPSKDETMAAELKGTVVNWLLYDIDTSASSTRDASAYELSPEYTKGTVDRRAKNGTNSWNITGNASNAYSTWVGPCTYPLGFPGFGQQARYEVELLIYKARQHNFAKPVTLGNFLSAIGDRDIVGRCSFHPVSDITKKGDVPKSQEHPQPFELTQGTKPIDQCDGLYGSDNFAKGHNATVPCGAYGCDCRLSPGNCAYSLGPVEADDDAEEGTTDAQSTSAS